MPRRDPFDAAIAALRTYALTFPIATEDHPWGETAIKVKGKVFVFLSKHDGNFHLSVKLPVTAAAALGFPFAAPTGYGLGKHNWVTATFSLGDMTPIDLLREWIDESYRAVAPKSVLAKFESAETDSRSAKPKTKTRKKGIR